MRILALDCALSRCTAAVVVDGQIAASRCESRERGQEALLPAMVQEVIHEAGHGIGLVAVTVGPGSFTGIRAGLALAHGVGLAFDAPVVGVTVGEAIADAFPRLGQRMLWTATESRRGHIFLERGAELASLPVEALPAPGGSVAIAGTAAPRVAASLAARGYDVMLTDARFPMVRHIAMAAARRQEGRLPARPARPLYVDPPEAKPPAGGLRPSPTPERPRQTSHPSAIVVATPAHATAMAEIHRAAFHSGTAGIGIAWSRDVMLLQLELPATFGFIHPDGGMILARVAADEAEVLTLAVDPARRRQGLASALLRAAMERAAAMGANTMFLEVAVSNAAARGLYGRHGFTEAGLRRHYYADGADALILRSTLAAATAVS